MSHALRGRFEASERARRLRAWWIPSPLADRLAVLAPFQPLRAVARFRTTLLGYTPISGGRRRTTPFGRPTGNPCQFPRKIGANNNKKCRSGGFFVEKNIMKIATDLRLWGEFPRTGMRLRIACERYPISI